MSNQNVDIQIGPHVATPLAADVVRIAWRGDVLAEHIRAVGQVIAARPHEGRGVFLLQDHTQIGEMTSGARKQIKESETARVVRRVVVFGASFRVRAVLTMLEKAMRTFAPKNEGTTFCDSEAEAMAFIDEVRRKQPSANVG